MGGLLYLIVRRGLGGLRPVNEDVGGFRQNFWGLLGCPSPPCRLNLSARECDMKVGITHGGRGHGPQNNLGKALDPH